MADSYIPASRRRRGNPLHVRKLKPRLLEEAGHKCQSCGIEVRVGLPDGHRNLATIDHIVPRGLGGSNGHSNLQILCCPCNRKKSEEESRICRTNGLYLEFQSGMA